MKQRNYDDYVVRWYYAIPFRWLPENMALAILRDPLPKFCYRLVAWLRGYRLCNWPRCLYTFQTREEVAAHTDEQHLRDLEVG